MREDVMRRMARCTGRRNGKTLLQKSFAVYALGIILDNVCLGDVALTLDGSSLFVAFAAHIWYTYRCYCGTRIFHRYDVMCAVTVFATRSQVIPASRCLSMPAL